MRRNISFLFLFFAFSFQLAFADGMYLPLKDKLPAKQIRQLGLKITPAEIEKMGQTSIVRLSGCSSTFMSSKGLIGTNWHCAYGCVNRIAQMARVEHGKDHALAMIGETGYVAKSYDQELKCEGEEALVPVELKNVSSQFRTLLNDEEFTPKERADAIRKKKEVLREKCMKDSKKYVCDVVFMNNEKDPYYLFKYRKYTDVRLVWSVPDVLGGFGGNVDNWEYPRHCADFAFLRVYENDKPIQPAGYVPASPKGFQPGDPQFILGYPGSTERNISSAAAELLSEMELPYMHHVYGELMNGIREISEKPKESPYKSSWARLDNYYENFERKAELIRELKVVKKKRSQERRKAGKERRQIEKIVEQAYAYFPTLYLLDRLTSDYPTYGLRAASYVWQWNNQPKDDKDRPKDTFKSWNKDKVLFSVSTADDQITLEGEKKLAATYFRLADALKIRIPTIDRLRDETQTLLQKVPPRSRKGELSYEDLAKLDLYEQMAEVLYRDTKMLAKNDSKKERARAKEYRLKLLKMRPQELVDMGDKLILFAKGLVEDEKDIRSDPEKAARIVYELPFLNYRQNLRMGYETADANFTLRFTASEVKENYEPIYKKGKFGYVTTLSELIKKDRMLDMKHPEHDMFVVPEYLKKAHARLDEMKGRFYYDEKLKDVPINFITQHIITGGNSGSGIFNAEGKHVGFAFDGTPESILDDVQLHPRSRTIAVDIRYAGFLGNEVFPNAKRVLKEIGLPTY